MNKGAAEMKVLVAVLLGVWLSFVPQSSLAHDTYAVMLEGGLESSLFSEQLNVAIENFTASEEGGYLPTASELRKIGEIFAARGGVFNEGFFIKIGGEEKYDRVIYFYLFASGEIGWSIEEWTRYIGGEDYIYYTRWRFRPDNSFFTVSLKTITGSLKDIVYEEVIGGDLLASLKSRFVLDEILEFYNKNK